MKPSIRIKLACVLCAIISYTALFAQKPYWQIPDSLSWGKEPPRGEVVCYASTEESVEKSYHKSAYLQPIVQWERNESPEVCNIHDIVQDAVQLD
ncbi:MAG: hypothetical protein L6V35_02010 [Alistipes putredinis]|nr:MAG: hypothetical protein L6V35_02010 [Alistipes putredinis]